VVRAFDGLSVGGWEAKGGARWDGNYTARAKSDSTRPFVSRLRRSFYPPALSSIAMAIYDRCHHETLFAGLQSM